MKGVILGGGLGSRLYPLTYANNKHLLPVYDQPMIFYPIQTLIQAGITEILIVVGGPNAGDYIKVLRNGTNLGLKHLAFAYQEGEGGIAQALSLAQDFADGDSIAVILGDNTTDADITPAIKSFTSGAKIFLKKVSDPERFGVPVFDEQKNIIAIEEKPKQPKSQYAVVGLYVYDNKVFDYIKTIKPSGRGELEITDVNNCYIQNQTMQWSVLEGFWSDAGTFDSLFLSSCYWAEKKNKLITTNLNQLTTK